MSKIKEMIRVNTRLTIREISNVLNILYARIDQKSVNMKQINPKFVPRVLSKEKKQFRLQMSLELFDRVNAD